MLNTYTVIAVNSEAPFVDADNNPVSDVSVNTQGADALTEWFLSQEALDIADEYGVADYGEHLFYVKEDAPVYSGEIAPATEDNKVIRLSTTTSVKMCIRDSVDGDVFETSNLNRQLNSTPALIGSSKAAAAAERVKTISPGTCITPVQAFFDETNAEELIQDQDLVIDALDNLSSRFLMEDVCEKQRVPFVHGAIRCV